MKLKYKFATETIEIDVSEEWGLVLRELNREEYNINHKETRRHESYSHNTDKQETLEDMDVDIEADFNRSCEVEELHKALSKLNISDLDIIHRLYLDNNYTSQAELAKEMGVTENCIKQRAKNIKTKIKNILKNS